MLVSRGVVNRIDTPRLHHVQQLFLITDRPKDRQQLYRQRLACNPLLQFGHNAVKIELTMLKQQKRSGSQHQYLAAKLRSDRSTCPRHQHDLAPDAMLEQIALRRHGIAPEQVRNIHFLNVVNFYTTARQIHKAGNTSDMQWKAFQVPQYFTTPPAICRRDGQKDFLSPGNIDHLLNMLGLVNVQSRNDPVSNTGIVIDKRDRSHQSSHAKRCYQLVSRRSCSVDCNLWQPLVSIREWDMLSSSKPIAKKILAHC
ncbi:hypothetical protein D3C76_562240 [compost metagenome]